MRQANKGCMRFPLKSFSGNLMQPYKWPKHNLFAIFKTEPRPCFQSCNQVADTKLEKILGLNTITLHTDMLLLVFHSRSWWQGSKNIKLLLLLSHFGSILGFQHWFCLHFI